MERHCIEKELLASLHSMGYDDTDSSATYEDVVRWLNTERGIVITVLPIFGEKIDYDTFKLCGYYYECDSIDKNGGIFLMYDSYHWSDRSYRYVDEEGVPIDKSEWRRESFPTRDAAVEAAVRFAVKMYKFWSTCPYDKCFNMANIEERTEYPKYLAFLSPVDEKYHTPLVFDHYEGTEYSVNHPIYRSWDKDRHQYGKVEVLWDGKEFIVTECKKRKELEGRKAYVVDAEQLLFIKFMQDAESFGINAKSLDKLNEIIKNGRAEEYI